VYPHALQLQLYTTYHRRGKHNIANRRKTDDEQFHDANYEELAELPK
jgi:hypothetical protein